MSKLREYTEEELQKKTKEELIKIVQEQNDEIYMLQFLIDEYENAQQALGKAVDAKLADYLKEMVIGKTVGEA